MNDKPMHQIEKKAYELSQSRQILAARMATLDVKIKAAMKQAERSIKSSLVKATEQQKELEALINANRESFVKPKTVTFHGIKLGLRKGKGKVEFDNENQVIELVKKHLGKKAESLIKRTDKLLVAAINNLTTKECKKIGVTIVDAGDDVLIKDTQNAVDKMVEALLADLENPGK